MILLVLPDIPDEDRLLAQARTGDRKAVMTIYENYFPPIYKFIRLRVSDRSVAEDLASDVFVKFVGSLGTRRAPRQSLRGWLFRVARNELSNHYGKQHQYPTETLEEWVPASTDTDPEAQFIRSLSLERSRQALAQLSPDQQEVLILRFGQMLSLEDTADIMGKSVGAIKSLQFRAVNAMRRTLSDLTVGGA
jgi:RNA polymerase sigma-70 factor (ECF subfamily)